MKIYTRRGDKGKTSLVSGRRLDKSDLLIEAYGTVDELNAFVGDLISQMDLSHLSKELSNIQNILFNIGSLLARDGAQIENYPVVLQEDVDHLESKIDALDVMLTKMTAFILPSGNKQIAKAHICRTVCRRAERRIISLEDQQQFELIIIYLNRLSDYFFVLARYLHHTSGIPEVKWDPNFRDT